MAQQTIFCAPPAVGTDISFTVPSVGGTNISCTTNGTTTLTSSAAFGNVFIGMAISGTGIPAGTTVADIASLSSLTLSQAATDSTTGNRSFSYANPYWVLYSAHARLVTDANAATRIPKWTINDGAATHVIWSMSDPGQSASITVEWNLFDGAVLPANPTAGQLARLLPIPFGLVLKPGYQILTSTTLIQVGDQWSQIVLDVDQYAINPEPNYFRGPR